jgi:cytochrome c biogenesis protein CcmG/thiol:disulfide interchange protein DsbE
MRRSLLAVFTAIAGATLLALAIARWTGAGGEEGGMPPLSSGAGVVVRLSDRPVDLPAVAVTDLDGSEISNATLKGKVVLLNFWATWCGPCREEIPMLAALQTHYRDRLLIVGLSIDERPPGDVKAFARELGVNYPVVMATRALADAFGGVRAVPATFVVDPAGRIVQRHIGLLNGPRTEHEVRVLAGLPSQAQVETVKDTGQVLLANAAYATEIPGLELSALPPAVRERTLQELNTAHCSCGCGLTVAQCRINDPTCAVSLPLAKEIAEKTRNAVR